MYAPDNDFLGPLIPNMLLTGGNATWPPFDYEDVHNPQLQKSFIGEL